MSGVWLPSGLAAPGGGGSRAGGVGQGVEHGLHGAVVVGGGQEPRLVRRRREVDPGVEHRVEERGVRRRVGAGRVRRSRGPIAVGEEDREHRAGGLHDVGDAGAAQRVGRRGLDGVGGGADVGVDLVGREPQRGEAGGGGDRVPREGAGLVDRALRRQPRHHVGAAAERRGREAAAHHLAEGHQVGAPALDGTVEAPPAGRAGAEAGHHLVADEERAVPGAGLGEEGVEAGLGRDDAHVAGGGLGDQAGDPVGVLGEDLLDRGPVVVGQHQRQLGRGDRDARACRGRRSVARPEPAEASSESTWPW